jgi:uncharacterized protein (DUF952 family)
MNLVYHITTRNAALESRQTGFYEAESLEQAGFIHFSQRHQVLDVANAFYTGQNDLVILVVDPTHLRAELKYEAPAHPTASPSLPGAENLFPHLYGPLNMDAVVEIVDFPPGADGRFFLPQALI